jgi:hypothetical protein
MFAIVPANAPLLAVVPRCGGREDKTRERI